MLTWEIARTAMIRCAGVGLVDAKAKSNGA